MLKIIQAATTEELQLYEKRKTERERIRFAVVAAEAILEWLNVVHDSE